MCCTERARRRSRNSWNALRGKYVAVQNFIILCSGYFLTANSLATQSCLLQNTATKTKSDYLSFFCTGRLHFIEYFSFYFPDYPITLKIIIYNQDGRNSFILQTTRNNNKWEYRAVFIVSDQTKAIMAIHLGKQERLSGVTHCALISCRIADGLKRHSNPNPQPHHGVETMKEDLQF